MDIQTPPVIGPSLKVQMRSLPKAHNGLTTMVMDTEITWQETILTVALQSMELPRVTDTAVSTQIWIHSQMPKVILEDGPSHKAQMDVSMW